MSSPDVEQIWNRSNEVRQSRNARRFANGVIKPLLIFKSAEVTSTMPTATPQTTRALNLLKKQGCSGSRTSSLKESGRRRWLAWFATKLSCDRHAVSINFLSRRVMPHTLAEAAVLIPKGVICLISALQFHELTLQVPSAVWMGIERTAWRPTIEYPPIRFVRFSRSALTEGVARHRIERVEVPITMPPRTVVDCFRYRNKIGLDVALEGLREGLRRRRFKPDDLWRYARKARVWSIMQPYIEAMVAQ